MNAIIMNTNAGYNTEIVLDPSYDINDVVALVSVQGEMRLFAAYPKADPTDWLLPQTILDAGMELSANTEGEFKFWAAGSLTERDGNLYVGTRCVGTTEELTDLQTLIRQAMH